MPESHETRQEAIAIKDDRVPELLATLSHELRTPLQAVLGWARMLRLNQMNPIASDKAIKAIERNARFLEQLIDDLLDVSRMTAGVLRLERQAVNLVAVIEAALETVRPAADAKGIHVHSCNALATDPIVGDIRRLQQVVSNLLSNAIKFTPDGGRVDIDVRRVDSRMELRISDTGQGIGAEFLPLVFERFRQADASPCRDSGLGLGLAIVRQIVEIHGGHVLVESPGIDRGTTVTVTLPIQPLLALNLDSDTARKVCEGAIEPMSRGV